MFIRRCVFKEAADLNDSVFFERVMAVIEQLAQRGLGLELMSDEESEVTQLHQVTWQHPVEETTELSLVENTHYELSYLSMKSKLAWVPRLVISSFESEFACFGIHELLASASGRFIEGSTLIALGLLAKKQDPVLIDVLVKALDHDLARVRYAAAHAVALTRWPVFASELELLLKMENDQDVRVMAEYAYDLLERFKR